MTTPQLIWDAATGYDFFLSLDVLHEPAQYGLRGSWAAGVRSRLPAAGRDLLQKFDKYSKIWPVLWVITLPAAKDSGAILQELEQIPAAERLFEMAACCPISSEQLTLFRELAERGAWREQDKIKLREILRTHYQEKGKKKKLPSDEELIGTLEIWSQAEAYGARYPEALRTYYDVFFAEEEARIQPVLETAVSQAQSLAEQLPLIELLEKLSQGIRYDDAEIETTQKLHIIPSFWITPLTVFTSIGSPDAGQKLFIYGGRPAGVSLVPGEVVPELLHQTLKALADPTRLRILRYLSAHPLTPAELARRLRLRPPTVTHHLHTLRLARLVQLTLGYEGNRYTARRQAIDAACQMLEAYLDARTD